MKSLSKKNNLFNDNVDIVKIAASKYRYVKSGCEYDDILQNGYLGLHKACLKSYGAINFRAFAFIKVRGQILDGFREIDWVTRAERRRIKNKEYDFSMSLFEPLDIERNDPGYIEDFDFILRRKLQSAIAGLSDKHAGIIKSYFFDDEKQVDTAKRLGVSPSRVIQLRSIILQKLKKHLMNQGVSSVDI